MCICPKLLLCDGFIERDVSPPSSSSQHIPTERNPKRRRCFPLADLRCSPACFLLLGQPRPATTLLALVSPCEPRSPAISLSLSLDLTHCQGQSPLAGSSAAETKKQPLSPPCTSRSLCDQAPSLALVEHHPHHSPTLANRRKEPKPPKFRPLTVATSLLLLSRSPMFIWQPGYPNQPLLRRLEGLLSPESRLPEEPPSLLPCWRYPSPEELQMVFQWLSATWLTPEVNKVPVFHSSISFLY